MSETCVAYRVAVAAEPARPHAEVRSYPGVNILVLDGQEVARLDRRYVWTRWNLLMTAAEWFACAEAIAAWQEQYA